LKKTKDVIHRSEKENTPGEGLTRASLGRSLVSLSKVLVQISL